MYGSPQSAIVTEQIQLSLCAIQLRRFHPIREVTNYINFRGSEQKSTSTQESSLGHETLTPPAPKSLSRDSGSRQKLFHTKVLHPVDFMRHKREPEKMPLCCTL